MRARIYGRFSSKPQERGDSYRRQTEGAIKHAQQNKIDLVTDGRGKPIIYFDEGVSGKDGANLEKEFGRLLSQIQPGEICLVEALDRIGRQNPFLLGKLLYDLVQRDVTVIAWQENKTVTKQSMEEMDTQFSVFTGAAVGHQDNRRKMKRLKEVNTESYKLAAQGIATKNLSKYLPTSFIWDDTKKQIVHVAEKAKTIRRIFDLYTEKGFGTTTICKILNADNVPTVYAWNKTKKWLEVSVKKIIRNEAYAGVATIKGNRYECYKGIISKEQFNKAQMLVARFTARAGNQSGDKVRINNLFCGMAICEDCNGKLAVSVSPPRQPKMIMTGKHKGEMSRPKAGTTFAFRCLNRKLDLCETTRMRNTLDIESFFCSEFLHGTGDTLTVKSSLELKNKQAALIQRIEQCNTAIGNLFDMVEQGDKEAKDRIEKRRTDKHQYENELRTVTAELAEAGEIPSMMDKIDELLGTPEAKGAINNFFPTIRKNLTDQTWRRELSLVLPTFMSKIVINLNTNEFYVIKKDGTKTRRVNVDMAKEELAYEGIPYTDEQLIEKMAMAS
jgi:DNA invertase Pin-like site-specific DNA recombinase